MQFEQEPKVSYNNNSNSLSLGDVHVVHTFKYILLMAFTHILQIRKYELNTSVGIWNICLVIYKLLCMCMAAYVGR